VNFAHVRSLKKRISERFNRLHIAVQLPIVTGVFIFLLAAGMTTVAAAAQVLAVGWQVALHSYAASWLRVLLFSFPIGVAMGLALVGIGFLLVGIDKIVRRFYPKGIEGAFVKLAWVGLIGLIGCMIGRAVYDDARKKHPWAGPPQRANADAVQQVLSEQVQTLSGASDSAKSTLAALDQNEIELRRLRSEVTRTLTNLEEQRRAATKMAETAKTLHDQEEDLTERLRQLRELLGGHEPVTRMDFATSRWAGLWQGFFLGIVTSILGSYGFRWIEKKRRRGREDGVVSKHSTFKRG
jgi:hypothetical protein